MITDHVIYAPFSALAIAERTPYVRGHEIRWADEHRRKYGSAMAEYLDLCDGEDEATGSATDWDAYCRRFGKRILVANSYGFVQVMRFASEGEAIDEFEAIARQYDEACADEDKDEGAMGWHYDGTTNTTSALDTSEDDEDTSEGEDHEHRFTGPIKLSRLGGTPHRECDTIGCNVISLPDDEASEDEDESPRVWCDIHEAPHAPGDLACELVTSENMTKSTLADVRALNAWQLARLADVPSPDSLDSPGALFLARVRDSLVDACDEVGRVVDDEGMIVGDNEASDLAHELADETTPIYTHDVWGQFVDLCAYNEDLEGYVDESTTMEARARLALYCIAERLVLALVDEVRDLDEL